LLESSFSILPKIGDALGDLRPSTTCSQSDAQREMIFGTNYIVACDVYLK